MRVREAVLKDLSEIMKMGNTAGEFQVSGKTVLFWPESVLINCVKSKNTPFLVAEKNNQIIGFIIANYNPCFKKAVIENIFVHPKQRGKSIGEKLLKALFEKLAELKCEYACTLVEEKSSEAITFYERNGFNKGINCTWLDKHLNKTFEKKRNYFNQAGE